MDEPSPVAIETAPDLGALSILAIRWVKLPVKFPFMGSFVTLGGNPAQCIRQSLHVKLARPIPAAENGIHVNYLHPEWSPDGSKLSVTISREIGIDRYITHVGVMGSDGSGLMALAPATTWTNSSWSPDGKQIAFTSGTAGAPQIAWVSANGNGSGILVENGWSPDWH